MAATRIREVDLALSEMVQGTVMDFRREVLQRRKREMDIFSEYYDVSHLMALSQAKRGNQDIRNDLESLAQENEGTFVPKRGVPLLPASAEPVGTMLAPDFPKSSPTAWSEAGAAVMRDIDDLQVELDLDFKSPSEDLEDESGEGEMPNVGGGAQVAAHVWDADAVMYPPESPASKEPSEKTQPQASNALDTSGDAAVDFVLADLQLTPPLVSSPLGMSTVNNTQATSPSGTGTAMDGANSDEGGAQAILSFHPLSTRTPPSTTSPSARSSPLSSHDANLQSMRGCTHRPPPPPPPSWGRGVIGVEDGNLKNVANLGSKPCVAGDSPYRGGVGRSLTTGGGGGGNISGRMPSRGRVDNNTLSQGKVAADNKTLRSKVADSKPWMKDTHSSRNRSLRGCVGEACGARARCGAHAISALDSTSNPEEATFSPSTKKGVTQSVNVDATPLRASSKRPSATINPAKTIKSPDR